MHSSANDACKDAATDWPPPLKLTACYLPHVFPEDQQDLYAMEVMGGIEERRDGCIQQMAGTVRSKAISSFVRQAELTDYRMTLLLDTLLRRLKWHVCLNSIARPGPGELRREDGNR